jgi:hypothetical protein
MHSPCFQVRLLEELPFCSAPLVILRGRLILRSRTEIREQRQGDAAKANLRIGVHVSPLGSELDTAQSTKLSTCGLVAHCLQMAP